MANLEQQTGGRLLPPWLRGFVRVREIGLVLAAIIVGIGAGVLVVLIGRTVQAMHVTLFALDPAERLSAARHVSPWRVVLVPVAGGFLIAGLAFYGRRLSGRLADAIEANALLGGRLSLSGSVLVTVQTIASCGFGASVGLEAGYAQICSAVASRLGLALAARRADLRLLVGCGAAAAIAAAFGAPLAGAFYGFEVVIGTYTVGALAPVATSALVASLVSRSFDPPDFLIRPGSLGAISPGDLIHVVAIGVLCAFASILLMLAVAGSETLFRLLRVPSPWRSVAGGLAVGGMGLLTPQVLGAGHGALEVDLIASLTPAIVLGLILLKGGAAAVSLGSGFRGGLFFSSLMLGALLGRLYADVGFMLYPDLKFDPDLAALTGMAAMGTGIVGAPITMTALALETTGNFTITLAALAAAVVASAIVRELFGYSFATWRFHLRGEAIRGPHDVGWLRELSVKTAMTVDVRGAPLGLTLLEARTRFPLGSSKQIAVLDEAGRYAGLVMLDDLHTAAADADGAALSTLARHANRVLTPGMTVREALDLFGEGEADALIVVDSPATRRVVGVLTEAHALRRFGAELERQSFEGISR